jgi:hypothetical protein
MAQDKNYVGKKKIFTPTGPTPTSPTGRMGRQAKPLPKKPTKLRMEMRKKLTVEKAPQTQEVMRQKLTKQPRYREELREELTNTGPMIDKSKSNEYRDDKIKRREFEEMTRPRIPQTPQRNFGKPTGENKPLSEAFGDANTINLKKLIRKK